MTWKPPQDAVVTEKTGWKPPDDSVVTKESIPSKINRMAYNTVQGGLETLNAPLEVAGELVRGAVENPRRPLDDFRAPSIVQRLAPSTRTKQPPSIGIDVVNKLVRAAAAGLSTGNMDTAREAYNQDRGVLGTVEDVALAGLLGKLAPEVLNAPNEATGKALETTGQGMKKAASFVGKKAISTGFNVPEEAIAARFSNPEVIKNAGTAENLALKDVPNVGNKFKEVIKDLQGKAKKTLSTSRYIEPTASDMGGAFTKDEVIGAVDSARKELGGIYTKEGKTASKTLNNLKDDLGKIRNTISQNQVHDYIQKLDNEIPWTKVWKSPETLTLEDHAMIDVRTKLDGILKAKNKVYADSMTPLSDAINGRNDYLKKFALEKIRGGGYQPSDQTVSKIINATKDNKLATQRVLSKVNDITGIDLMQKIKNSEYLSDFQPIDKRGDTFYSSIRNTLSNPPIAGKLIDAASKVNNKIDFGVNAVKEGAKRTNADLVLELLRKKAPLIGSLSGDRR